MTDSSLEGMHYEYTFFVFFYTLVHMQKSGGTRSHDTRQWALQTRTGGQWEQLLECCISVQMAFNLKWTSSSKYSGQKSKYTDIPIQKKIVGRVMTSVLTGPNHFLLGGINHRGEERSSVGLMAKLETAGFSGTQGRIVETFLPTACCRSFLKMNISITKYLLV